ncbi:MAG: oligosaccharide flippase family protein [Ignavibacteriales bacterium]|nr:oligosaccharide flippase family protein [Ignavibacteriales bacterium]
MTLNSNIKKLLKFRSLFINFSFRSAANLLSKFIGLVTLPIITRALGPEGYGNFNLVNLIAQYTFLPIALLGLRTYGIREIAGEKKQNSYANNILSMQFSIAVIAVFISTIVTYIIFRSNSFLFISIIIGYLLVFTNTFDLEFFYVAKKDLVFPTLARLIGQAFYVGGVILFIKSPNDVPILVFLAALTPAIADLIQLKKFNSKYAKISFRPTFKEALNTLKTTYKLGISTNLEGFYPSIPQLFIPIFLGAYALGIFAGGYKIYSILVMFYVTLFYALAPYLVKLNSYTINVRRKYHLLMFVIILFFSGIIGLMLYLFGEPLLILILGKNFGESGIVFKAISLTLIPITPISMLLGNILIYSGNDKYYLYSVIISSISVLISSPILIKNYNVVGSVYALAISMFIGILSEVYFYFKSNS